MAGEKNTKYKKEYDELAYKFCLLGATDKRLGEFFGVTEQTINNWKRDHSTFFESLKRGKLVADSEIAEALFHRAKGYSHPEVKIATSEGQITDIKEFTKHYPPDTTAAIIWLKNRQPEHWRDKQEVETTAIVHNIMPVPTADSADDWEKAAQEQQAKALSNDD